jgi:hypothetical protein
MRFGENLRGGLGSSSGVIASARILTTFFLGNRAAIKTKAPACWREQHRGVFFGLIYWSLSVSI